MRIGKILVFAVLIACSGPTALPAAPDEQPRILRVQLYVRNGQLAGDVASTGLFSERIVGTVQSGLPAVVELFYQLSLDGDGGEERGIVSYSLAYDVWDDVYTVAQEDTLLTFPDFPSLRGMIEHLRGISLIPIDRLSIEDSYRLRMILAVSPLQGTQERKISSWVRDNVRRNQEDSWREQVLNLNELISHFFSRSGGNVGRSDWFELGRFKPADLPDRDGKVR